MEPEYSQKEKIVGTFLILVTIIFFATLIIIGRGKNWFETYVTYYTMFDESYNLQKNAEVKLFNAAIGKVREIELAGNRVKVKLAIQKRYATRFRKNTTAQVESPTFIGSEYVAITPGGMDSPLLKPNEMIKSVAKKSLSDIMDEFEVEKTAKKFIKAVQDFSEFMEELKNPEGPLIGSLNNIHDILNKIDLLVTDVTAGKGTAGQILRPGRMQDSIQTSLKEVETILKQISSATEQAPEIAEKVKENLDEIHASGKVLKKDLQVINDVLFKISEVVDQLKTVSENLKRGSEDVPGVIDSTRHGIEEIRNGVKKIDNVVESLQKNFLIKPNLPPEPVGKNVDAGLRE